MEKPSKNDMLKVVEDFLKSKPEESFSHGVIAKTYKKANKEQLKHMAKVLLEWAGTFLWEQGYELDYGKDIEWTAESCDFGRKPGIALTVYGKFTPRLKQFCYQFLRIAEDAIKKVRGLELEIKRLQSVHLAMMFKYNKQWDWGTQEWVDAKEDEDDY